MAYPRSINAEWKVGMEVEYQRPHHHTGDPVVLVTIKRISPKLGVAVCDIARHDGTVEERKFQLGYLDYANECSKERYSRFRASIVIPSAQRTKQREDAIKLAALKQRQQAAMQFLIDNTKYHVLSEFDIFSLESIVEKVKEAQK